MVLTVHYFGAVWCGPCKRAKPFIQQKQNELTSDNLQFIFWNIDDDAAQTMADKWKVEAVPTIIFSEDNEQVLFTMRGWADTSEKTFMDAIDKYLTNTTV